MPEPDPPQKEVLVKGGEPEVSEWAKLKYLEEIKLYLKNKERLSSTVVGLFNVVWGQCSRKVQNRCRAHADYPEIKNNHKIAEVLKVIRDITHQFESQTHLFDSLDHAVRKYYTYKQADYEKLMQCTLKMCKT